MKKRDREILLRLLQRQVNIKKCDELAKRYIALGVKTTPEMYEHLSEQFMEQFHTLETIMADLIIVAFIDAEQRLQKELEAKREQQETEDSDEYASAEA